jgi:hypothetical protein
MPVGKLNKPNGNINLGSVHDSYPEDCNRLKTRDGSPAWIRTTITLRNAESIIYRVFNGLKCQIGAEEPPLVHSSYIEFALDAVDAPKIVPNCSRNLKGYVALFANEGGALVVVHAAVEAPPRYHPPSPIGLRRSQEVRRKRAGSAFVEVHMRDAREGGRLRPHS